MTQPVRFQSSYQGYAPETIFSVDQASKQLRPFSSGEAYTGSGFQFGQEAVADPNAYGGYTVGTAINRAGDLAAIKNELNQFQNQTFQEQQPTPMRQSSALQTSIDSANTDYNTGLAPNFGTNS